MVGYEALKDGIASGLGATGNVLISWLGYFFISLFILGIIWGTLWWFSYKYKAEIYIRRSSGTGDYSIGKIRKTKIREIVRKGVRKWKIMGSRVTMPPLDDKYILPGNNVKLFQVDKYTYIPATYKIGNPEMTFTALPQDIRMWQVMEISNAAQEYQDPRSKLMPLFITIGTVFLCLMFAGIVFWFTYNHANQVVGALGGINENIMDVVKSSSAQEAFTG